MARRQLSGVTGLVELSSQYHLLAQSVQIGSFYNFSRYRLRKQIVSKSEFENQFLAIHTRATQPLVKTFKFTSRQTEQQGIMRSSKVRGGNASRLADAEGQWGKGCLGSQHSIIKNHGRGLSSVSKGKRVISSIV